MKSILALGILALSLVGFSARAYSYDDEQIRRDAQKLVEWDKAEREAAAKRYDQAHRESSPDNPVLDLFCIILIGGGTFAVYNFSLV